MSAPSGGATRKALVAFYLSMAATGVVLMCVPLYEDTGSDVRTLWQFAVAEPGGLLALALALGCLVCPVWAARRPDTVVPPIAVMAVSLLLFAVVALRPGADGAGWTTAGLVALALFGIGFGVGFTHFTTVSGRRIADTSS